MTQGYVVGVDAGGTKTVAWLAEATAEVSNVPIAIGSSGPGNIRSVGFETATNNIRSAVDEAINELPLPVRTLCICAAGAGRESDQMRLREWAESLQIASRIVVTSDVEAVLASASTDQVGVALIAGTGSLAWGRNAAGETHRTGGWGHILGDEGSAYDIARSALQSASQMADRRLTETLLLETMLRALKLRDAGELVSAIYEMGQPKQEIAKLAPNVFACAAEGDIIAKTIIDGAADCLGRMAATVADRLNLSGDYILAMTGGVLFYQNKFRQRLMNDLRPSGANAVLVEHPVFGAVRIAQAVPESGSTSR